MAKRKNNPSPKTDRETIARVYKFTGVPRKERNLAESVRMAGNTFEDDDFDYLFKERSRDLESADLNERGEKIFDETRGKTKSYLESSAAAAPSEKTRRKLLERSRRTYFRTFLKNANLSPQKQFEIRSRLVLGSAELEARKQSTALHKLRIVEQDRLASSVPFFDTRQFKSGKFVTADVLEQGWPDENKIQGVLTDVLHGDPFALEGEVQNAWAITGRQLVKPLSEKRRIALGRGLVSYVKTDPTGELTGSELPAHLERFRGKGIKLSTVSGEISKSDRIISRIQRDIDTKRRIFSGKKGGKRFSLASFSAVQEEINDLERDLISARSQKSTLRSIKRNIEITQERSWQEIIKNATQGFRGADKEVLGTHLDMFFGKVLGKSGYEDMGFDEFMATLSKRERMAISIANERSKLDPLYAQYTDAQRRDALHEALRTEEFKSWFKVKRIRKPGTISAAKVVTPSAVKKDRWGEYVERYRWLVDEPSGSEIERLFGPGKDQQYKNLFSEAHREFTNTGKLGENWLGKSSYTKDFLRSAFGEDFDMDRFNLPLEDILAQEEARSGAIKTVVGLSQYGVSLPRSEIDPGVKTGEPWRKAKLSFEDIQKILERPEAMLMGPAGQTELALALSTANLSMAEKLFGPGFADIDMTSEDMLYGPILKKLGGDPEKFRVQLEKARADEVTSKDALIENVYATEVGKSSQTKAVQALETANLNKRVEAEEKSLRRLAKSSSQRDFVERHFKWGDYAGLEALHRWANKGDAITSELLAHEGRLDELGASAFFGSERTYLTPEGETVTLPEENIVLKSGTQSVYGKRVGKDGTLVPYIRTEMGGLGFIETPYAEPEVPGSLASTVTMGRRFDTGGATEEELQEIRARAARGSEYSTEEEVLKYIQRNRKGTGSAYGKIKSIEIGPDGTLTGNLEVAYNDYITDSEFRDIESRGLTLGKRELLRSGPYQKRITTQLLSDVDTDPYRAEALQKYLTENYERVMKKPLVLTQEQREAFTRKISDARMAFEARSEKFEAPDYRSEIVNKNLSDQANADRRLAEATSGFKKFTIIEESLRRNNAVDAALERLRGISREKQIRLNEVERARIENVDGRAVVVSNKQSKVVKKAIELSKEEKRFAKKISAIEGMTDAEAAKAAALVRLEWQNNAVGEASEKIKADTARNAKNAELSEKIKLLKGEFQSKYRKLPPTGTMPTTWKEPGPLQKVGRKISRDFFKKGGHWKRFALITGSIMLGSWLLSRNASVSPAAGEDSEDTQNRSLYGGGQVAPPEGFRFASGDKGNFLPTTYTARVQDPQSYRMRVSARANVNSGMDFSKFGDNIGRTIASNLGVGDARVNMNINDDTRSMSNFNIKRKLERVI